MSNREEDLRKSLKTLYDDLCNAENKQEKEPFGFKNRLKVIHEHLQDLEWRLAATFPHLGEFGTLGDFEPNYHRLGDSGMDQELKTQIKRLAIEIDANLEKKDIQDYEELLEIPIDNFKGIFNVFISHKFVSLDQELALSLREELRKYNVEGYLAEGKREYHLLIGDKIKDAIDKSEYVVAIITKHSQTSASVNQELGYALGTNKPIVIMIEKDIQQGVLTHGRDPEEFTRATFSKSCENVVRYILERGSQEKISDTEKKFLQENVYPHLYNDVANVYERRHILEEIPSNPWDSLPPAHKIRVEQDIADNFVRYGEEIKIWKEMINERESDFVEQKNDLAGIIYPAFDELGLINEFDSITLQKNQSISVVNWLHKFRFILFNPKLTDAGILHKKLVEQCKNADDSHEKWLNEISGKVDLFRYLVKLLPELRKNFETNISEENLEQQREKLRIILEKIKPRLEEELK